MAVIVTMFECDYCETIAKVQTDEEWKKFDETWEDAGEFHFCQNCKKLPSIELFILDENARINLMIDSYTSTEVLRNANF